MTDRCPITYESIGEGCYSRKGLNRLSPNLNKLRNLPYSAAEQRMEAARRAGKMSIQGRQPKLSARLSIKNNTFQVVDRQGRYILKPQVIEWEEVPENEDLTMRLAAACGIEVPLHGLIYSSDRSFTYFIKRFDRFGQGERIPLEDFAQLSGKTRNTKYKSSLEQVVKVVQQYCTFPQPEKAKLFRRCLFSFLVGNEDMHLKNFSIIQRREDPKIYELSPAYDLVNSTIVWLKLGKNQDDIEETALPLNGKKKRLTESDWLDYFGRKRMNLSEKTINGILQTFSRAIPEWKDLIARSFISEKLKNDYREVINRRIDLFDDINPTPA